MMGASYPPYILVTNIRNDFCDTDGNKTRLIEGIFSDAMFSMEGANLPVGSFKSHGDLFEIGLYYPDLLIPVHWLILERDLSSWYLQMEYLPLGYLVKCLE